MKKIVVLFIACLLMFCGCNEAETDAEFTTESDMVTEKVFTVTFDSQGGSAVETQVVAWGEKVIEPSTPMKYECEFDGWHLGDEKWSFIGYTVTEDITLTAVWIEWPTFGLNEKELEIIRNMVSNMGEGTTTWQDVEDVRCLGSCNPDGTPNEDSIMYGYEIVFKSGSTRLVNIAKDCV